MSSSLFTVHKLNAQGMRDAQRIAEAFTRLLSELEPLCLEGREFSIARTKLEEACFFAKKAMATLAFNQEPEPSEKSPA